MSRSARIHKESHPYYHPFTREMPPSKAARFVAETFPRQERGQRNIVDAGCSEGQDTLFLLSEGFRVIAVDISERNLGIVARKVSQAQIPSDAFGCCVADMAEQIPIEDAVIDAVLDVWVLGSVILPHDGRTGAKQYLTEVHRILKPGGFFVLQFETIKPRRSPDRTRGYLANLMKGYFSITASEAISVNYVRYVDVPHQGKLNSAVFVVTCKQ